MAPWSMMRVVAILHHLLVGRVNGKMDDTEEAAVARVAAVAPRRTAHQPVQVVALVIVLA